MLSDVYFPRVNGVSTSIATFRRELAALGHRVTLVAPAYGPADPAEPDLLRAPARRIPFDPEDRLLRRTALRDLAMVAAHGGVDLVHVQTPFVAHGEGVRLARALGVPVVETYHTHFEQYFEHYLPFFPRRLLRALARSLARRQGNAVDRLIVPSRAMQEVLTAYGVKTPLAILPTGLSRAEFAGGNGARFRAAHGIPAERPLLLHVGRLGHEKNVLFLLEVFAALVRERPDALLLFAGEGPARPALERRARELGVSAQVVFVGYLERRAALLDCYRAADVFLFASRTETQGLVLLEAMALGVPIVTTAELGTRDLLAAGRGARVVAEKRSHFVAAILEILGDRAERERLGREGRELARQWSSEALAERLVALYRGLLAARASGHRHGQLRMPAGRFENQFVRDGPAEDNAPGPPAPCPISTSSCQRSTTSCGA